MEEMLQSADLLSHSSTVCSCRSSYVVAADDLYLQEILAGTISACTLIILISFHFNFGCMFTYTDEDGLKVAMLGGKNDSFSFSIFVHFSFLVPVCVQR